ncbi:MAG: IS66 family transposase [Steroidobacteraceae bacterium]
MQSHASTLEGIGALDPATSQLLAAKDKSIEELTARVEALSRQLDWFRRQMFGAKSERLVLQDNPQQISLGEMVDQDSAVAPPPKRRVVAEHTRAVSKAKDEGESLPFFDATQVPMQTIELPVSEALADEAYDRIGQKITYRLAQRPAAYVVLQYIRPLIKLRESGRLLTTPAPTGVIEGSRADVSFLAGMLVDKYQYHQPLYRIHQRLTAVGFNLSRPWLTQLSQQAIALLEPIYQAQLVSIKQSRIITMDETPIKAGREVQGKMRTAWFWPVHGEQQEICFPYAPTRQKEHIFKILGRHFCPDTVLLTDGNDSYARYAKAVGVEHAQCWSHNRRGYFEAKDYEPQRTEHALELIAKLYAVEDDIRDRALVGEDKRLYRLGYSKPVTDVFFQWVEQELSADALKAKTPLTEALAYTHKRRAALELFLGDPDLPLDTNHLERGLRVIPMGRKNWMFCWTELGAEHVGIMQSLIVTCRLHRIDPYTYLVDVLQRVGVHPANKVAELTPRLWNQHFAANPLRSALHTSLPA